MNTSKLFFILILWIVLGSLSGVVAQDDFLVIRSGNGETVRYDGKILDLDGRIGAKIRIGQREETFPPGQFVNFGTVLTVEHVNAEQLFQAKDYSAAVEQFLAARSEEPRNWVKRQITARIVQSYQALGQPEQACREFYLLARSDPETLYIACIPLPWFADLEREQNFMQIGRQGIDQTQNPSMRLLAAGLLLTSPDREKAVETLRELSGTSQKSIAMLAQAQLWRTKLFDAAKSEALTWEELTDTMPEPIRPGPHYLLGEVFSRLKEPEDAVAHWMKVVLVYPEQKRLAERCAEHASQTLRELGRLEQAQKLQPDEI